MGYQIAIDGPAGAGKSTIARNIAKELSFIYVDTGAMYRAMAVFFLEQGVDGHDVQAVTDRCTGADISIVYQDGEQRVLLNGRDVTPFLRKEEVGEMASVTSAVPAVRAHLMELQKNLARQNDVVMDGRDIGTVVLPDAQVKVFLTASVETRALRRYRELQEKGISAELAAIQEDIAQRDHRDMNRAAAPLKQAEDAVLVDSSDLTIEEVTKRILQLVEERRA